MTSLWFLAFGMILVDLANTDNRHTLSYAQRFVRIRARFTYASSSARQCGRLRGGLRVAGAPESRWFLPTIACRLAASGICECSPKARSRFSRRTTRVQDGRKLRKHFLHPLSKGGLC